MIKVICEQVDDVISELQGLNLATYWNPATGIIEAEAMFKPESNKVEFLVELKLRNE